MKRIAFIFIAFFCFISSSYSQIDTSFWFVAPEVWVGHDDRPIYLRFASFDEAATITISQPANSNFPTQTLNLGINDAQSIDLTAWIDIIENKPFNTVLNYGINISSTSLITAYYEEGSNNNPDIFALKGQNALGLEFYTPFQVFLNNNYNQSKSGIDIVATEDNTEIQITPTQNLEGHPANITFSIILNMGETYSLRAQSTSGPLHPSGTHIMSDKPIAVSVSDDSVLGNPYYGPTAYDLMGDQLIPVEQMGQEYIVIKGELNGEDKIYITASEDNTDIIVGGSIISTINASQTYQLDLFNPSIYFSTSKPVVALHMTGYGSELCGAILPPINCTGSQNVSFIRSINNPFFKLNILVESGGEDYFTFNGATGVITSADFSDVPNTSGEWKYASINNPLFVNVLANSNITNDSSFFHVGIIMGRNSSSRYGYFSNFNKFKHEITTSTETYCEGDELVLNGEYINNTDYNWNGPNGFSASGNNFTFGNLNLSDSGMYVLSGQLNECDVISDTINVLVSALDDASFSIDDFCIGDENTATITGSLGGTFSLVNATGGATINPTNAAISNATDGTTYDVVYSTSGNCPSTSIESITAFEFDDASFSISDFCIGNVNSAIITGTSGGTFSLINATSGETINPTNASINNAIDGTSYDVQYTTSGNCPSTSIESTTAFEFDDASFSISDFCIGIENTAIITGTLGGTFSLMNATSGETINPTTAAISNAVVETTYDVMYTTNGNCPSASIESTTALVFEDPSFTSTDFCYGESNSIVISGTSGGQFSFVTNPNGAEIDILTGILTNVSEGSIYNIEYTTPGSSSSCSSSSQESVEVYTVPASPFAPSIMEYCDGETILPISITPSEIGSVINWYSDSTLTNFIQSSNSYNIPYSIGSSTVYLNETSVNNCVSNYSSVIQTINPLPNIDAGIDQTICYGESIILSGNGGLNYSWTNGVQDNMPFSPSVGLNTYILIGEDSENCFNTDTVDINVNPIPNPFAGNDQDVCGLETNLLATDNGISSIWSNNNAIIDNPNSHQTSVSVSNYGIYTFYWTETNAFGCSETDNISINFLETPEITLSTDYILVCENEEVILNGSSNNSSNPVWSTNGSGNFITNANSILYDYSQSDIENGDIEVYFTTTLDDCSDTDTVSISIKKLPTTNLFTDNYLCEEDTSMEIYIYNSGNAPFKYELEFNNDIIYTNSTFNSVDTVVINKVGRYRVVKFTDTYCLGNSSDELNVFVRENPLANFTTYPRETSIYNPLIQMNNFSLNIESCQWWFGDSTYTDSDCNPSHLYQDIGTFEITMHVENEFGCTDSMKNQVIINPEFELFIPSAFTPDNDQVNDYFFCKGFGVQEFNLSVFSRWGELIFTSKDLNIGWDGTSKKGETCMNGVYSYRVEVIDLLGKKHFFDGEVHLIR